MLFPTRTQVNGNDQLVARRFPGTGCHDGFVSLIGEELLHFFSLSRNKLLHLFLGHGLERTLGLVSLVRLVRAWETG